MEHGWLLAQLALRGEAPCLSKGMESRLGAGYRRWQRLTLVPYSPYLGGESRGRGGTVQGCCSVLTTCSQYSSS